MEKNNNQQPLTDIEWTTLWMSIRYACGRQTIASATLPNQIIKSYWNRLTDQQKEEIYDDLKRDVEFYGDNSFGSQLIDKPVWLKFMAVMDKKNRKTVIDINDKTHEVFEVNGRYYPLYAYTENPHQEIYLPVENIKEFL